MDKKFREIAESDKHYKDFRESLLEMRTTALRELMKKRPEIVVWLKDASDEDMDNICAIQDWFFMVGYMAALAKKK